MPIDPTLIASGVSALSGLLGSGGSDKSARKYYDAQAKLTNAMTQQYNAYMPQILSELWYQYQNPDTPALQAQMQQSEADALRNYTQADSRLQRSLTSRGLGQSSFTRNTLGALWNAYGQTMANARVNQVGAQEQRRQQALAGLMGAIPNTGQMSSSYNAMGNSYQNQANQFNTALGDLSALAASLYNMKK